MTTYLKSYAKEAEKHRITIITILILSFIAVPISFTTAQVTIGDLSAPKQGALLDLKEDSDGSSTKGLLLPRVHLTKRSTLQDIAAGKADSQRLAHTGLTVYNVNPTAPFCPGVFVWSSVSWMRLGEECPPYLIGPQDVDFGTSAAAKPITFKTNQSWSYTTENNYASVISSATKTPDVVHSGGDLAEVGEATVTFNIGPSLTPNDPANTRYSTQLHFKTQEHPDGLHEEKTITVRRTVASRWENAAIPTVVSRTGGNITFAINTNDRWGISGPNNSADFPAASFRTRSLTFYIPPNDDWNKKTHTVYTHRHNSVTGTYTQVNHNVIQNEYYFNVLGNSGVPSPMPAMGGTFYIDVRGNGKICPVVMYLDIYGNASSPAWQTNRTITLPEDGSGTRLYFDVSSNFGALAYRTVRVCIGRFKQDGVTAAGYTSSIADVSQGNLFRKAEARDGSEAADTKEDNKETD